jgi:hypothetical protein
VKALTRYTATAVLTTALLLLFAGAASAASPWWQLSTSSRPTNFWLPKSEVQELRKAPHGLTLIAFEEDLVACMGGSACTTSFSMPDDETAGELQASLEAVYGAGEVEVTEDPQIPLRFLITSIGASAGRFVTPLSAAWTSEGGEKIKVLQEGGSGRLTLTLTNLGDASVEAAKSALNIVDRLPEGISAYHAEAFAGLNDKYGPVSCSVESPAEVSCAFHGALPPYEAIEVEIYASLTGEPQASGENGEVTVSGSNAAPVQSAQQLRVTPEPTRFGVEHYAIEPEGEGGVSVTQAGSHPFQLTSTLVFNQGPLSPGNRAEAVEEQPAQPRNLRFLLPAGLVGNATRFRRCSFDVFTTTTELINRCPADAAIGAASVTVIEPGPAGFLRVAVPVFNLDPLPGEPARFGFMAGGVPVTLDAEVRSGESYRVRVEVLNASQLAQVLASTVTFWGSPSDPRHDVSRGWDCVYAAPTGPCTRPTGLPEASFLRLPTSCGHVLSSPMEMEPWSAPLGTAVVGSSFSSSALDGCNRVPFSPTIQLQPETERAESATGLTARLRIPQEATEAPGGIGESDLQTTRVKLPAGLRINPAGANGLQACSEEQAGFKRIDSATGEAVFDEAPATCPNASKLGTVRISSPLLEEDVQGSVYQAAQGAGNPFGSLIAFYIVADAPRAGVHVKLASKVEPTAEGLVSTVENSPQVPFEEFELHFFGGPTAPLATSGCGPYRTEAKLAPWAGNPPATPTTEFQVGEGTAGGPCSSPFAPVFSAGTEIPLAGSYSHFLLRLSRSDGTQQVAAIDTTLPAGLTGKLAGIPYCPDSSIQRALERNKPGDGTLEAANPSCPPASRVATVRVASGVGSSPYVVSGDGYLAGPYKGAPLSLFIVTPAVAGPFDLGAVTVRVALYVDPETTVITAKSDPLPTELQGIPLDLRSIFLTMDRSKFTLNPTSCKPSKVLGTATSIFGESASLQSPFQVGGCRGLDFKPKLKLRLDGATRRSGHPKVRAVVTFSHRTPEANAASIQVGLPHALFLDQGNLDKVCTQPQLRAQSCPARSVYGRVRAWTPLLARPLEGPVYLGVGFGYKLPALVADLNGQIRVLSHARVDTTKHGGLRSTFSFVPDAPLSRIVLEMKGGKKYGLLENSESLCNKTQRASAHFVAHNGQAVHLRPKIVTDCGKRRKKR